LSNVILYYRFLEQFLFYCLRVSTSCVLFFSTKRKKMAGYEISCLSYKIFSNLALFIWNILYSFYINKTRKMSNFICYSLSFELLLFLLFKCFFFMYFILEQFLFYCLRVSTSCVLFFSTKRKKMAGYEISCLSYKIFSNLALFIWNILYSFYINKTRKMSNFICYSLSFELLLFLLFKCFFFMYFIFFN